MCRQHGMHIKHGLVLLILLTSSHGLLADVEGSFFIDVERIQQSFERGEADIDTVTLSPALHLSDWSLSLAIPWQHVEGTYFVNNRFPNLAYFCEQLSTLTPKARLLLVRRGTLTPAQVLYCQNYREPTTEALNTSSEGFSDIDGALSYYLPPISAFFDGSVTLGYIHDNGDYEDGLGTGTRESYLETSWLWRYQSIDILTTVGYQFLLKNDTDIELDDYSYGSANLRWQWFSYSAIGLEYQYVQANTDFLDDLEYVTWYLEIGGSKGLRLRIAYTDYDETGYPEEEYRANLSYSF